MRPLISVVIPTFGRAVTISRAIESVLSQEDVDVEVIVVDDNGQGTRAQQQTAEIVRGLSQSKVKYIPHSISMSGSIARNTGIASAQGDYVAFLDDDDEWSHSRKAAAQISRMSETGSAAALSGFIRIVNGVSHPPKSPAVDEDFALRVLAHSVDTAAGSTLLVSRRVVDGVGLFDPTFVRHQDLEFLYRVARDHPVCVVPEIMVTKHHEKSLRRVMAARDIEAYRLHFLEAFADDIAGLPDDVRRRVLEGHYRSIARAHLKQGSMGRGTYWIFRTKNPILSMALLARSGLSSVPIAGMKRPIGNRSAIR